MRHCLRDTGGPGGLAEHGWAKGCTGIACGTRESRPAPPCCTHHAHVSACWGCRLVHAGSLMNGRCSLSAIEEDECSCVEP